MCENTVIIILYVFVGYGKINEEITAFILCAKNDDKSSYCVSMPCTMHKQSETKSVRL